MVRSVGWRRSQDQLPAVTPVLGTVDTPIRRSEECIVGCIAGGCLHTVDRQGLAVSRGSAGTPGGEKIQRICTGKGDRGVASQNKQQTDGGNNRPSSYNYPASHSSLPSGQCRNICRMAADWVKPAKPLGYELLCAIGGHLRNLPSQDFRGIRANSVLIKQMLKFNAEAGRRKRHREQLCLSAPLPLCLFALNFSSSSCR